MITIELKGERVTVRPRSLHSYIEKCDYIKGRRPSPYDSLRDLPEKYQDTQAKRDKYLEMAMMVSMKISSVGFDEEADFDRSYEAVYLSVWQALKDHYKWPKSPHEGVDVAEKWYSKLDSDVQLQLLVAVQGLDQRKMAKNSDGPVENPPKGPEEQAVQAEIIQPQEPQTVI